MNKKGISLAINQIVILIIGVVVLGLGIAFAVKVFTVGEYQLPGVEERVQKAIEESLKTGDVVQIPISSRTIGAKELALFNLGILYDRKGDSKRAYQMWVSARGRGVRSKNLQRWISIKKRIFGYR